jgi:death-on-curing protein
LLAGSSAFPIRATTNGRLAHHRSAQFDTKCSPNSSERSDYVVIASEVLESNTIDVLRVLKVASASSAITAPATDYFGVELFPQFHMKRAVLGYRLLRNHLLPDGNKRCAFLAMIEFVERNGCMWRVADDDDTVKTIESAAAGDIDEAAFADWVRKQIV